MFEALQFDCNVYVIELEGYQYMKYLLESNYARLLDPEFTLEDLVEFQSATIRTKEYFFNSL